MMIAPKELRANLKFRAKLLSVTSEAEQQAILRAVADDPILFFDGFVFQYNPKAGRGSEFGPFILRPYQEDYIRWLVGHIDDPADLKDDLLTKKSREVGATWLALGISVWLGITRNYQSVLLISRTENEVDKPGDPDCLMWKIDHILQHLPPWLAGPIDRKKNHIEFLRQRSFVDGTSTTERAGRGGRRTLLIADENAFMPKGFAMNVATRETAKLRLKISTPAGVATSFAYDEKRLIKLGRRDRIKYLHWSQDPVKSIGLYTIARATGAIEYIDKDYWTPERALEYNFVHERPQNPDYPYRSPWYDEKCKQYHSPEAVAQELDMYDVGSESLFYNPVEIERLMGFCRPGQVGHLVYEKDTGTPERWLDIPDPENEYQLWCDLTDGKPKLGPCVIGCDVAGGVGSTPSVASIVTISGLKVCSLRSRTMRPDQFAVCVAALAYWFSDDNKVPALVNAEPMGPGGLFFFTLERMGFGRVWRRSSINHVGKVTISNTKGFPTSGNNKRYMHECYRRAIYNGTFRNFDRDALEECLSFIVVGVGLAPEHRGSVDVEAASGTRGVNHGDACTADCLANLMLPKSEDGGSAAKLDAPVNYPPESIGWCIQQRKRESLGEYG